MHVNVSRCSYLFPDSAVLSRTTHIYISVHNYCATRCPVFTLYPSGHVSRKTFSYCVRVFKNVPSTKGGSDIRIENPKRFRFDLSLDTAVSAIKKFYP